MDVVRGTAYLNAAQRGGVLAIGNYDGVHCGHQEILRQVTARAQSLGVPSGLLTFAPHPTTVLAPAQQLQLLQSEHQKLQSLANCGLDFTIVEEFSPTFAQVSADDFFTEILLARCAPRHLIVGYDLTYGKHRSGTVQHLRSMCEQHGVHCSIVEPVFIDDVLVSSTYVRRCIAHGELQAARRALGRPHSIAGELRSGHGIGKTLGYPTINMMHEQQCLPPDGVYITNVSWPEEAGAQYPAATYLGNRPTFNGTEHVIESYVLDATPPHTLKDFTIHFHDYVRGEMKFESADALTAQITRDVAAAKTFHGMVED